MKESAIHAIYRTKKIVAQDQKQQVITYTVFMILKFTILNSLYFKYINFFSMIQNIAQNFLKSKADIIF